MNDKILTLFINSTGAKIKTSGNFTITQYSTNNQLRLIVVGRFASITATFKAPDGHLTPAYHMVLNGKYTLTENDTESILIENQDNLYEYTVNIPKAATSVFVSGTSARLGVSFAGYDYDSTTKHLRQAMTAGTQISINQASSSDELDEGYSAVDVENLWIAINENINLDMEQNERLDAQNERLDVQNERLNNIDAKNAEQDNRLNTEFVNKTNIGSQVYGTHGDGRQRTITYDVHPAADTIALRSMSGDCDFNNVGIGIGKGIAFHTENEGDNWLDINGVKLTNSLIGSGIRKGSGNYSIEMGYLTEASGNYSHAEGQGTTASGYNSHAEGLDTTASGHSSHAGGYNTTASGDYSHASGCKTTAGYHYQTTIGKYNNNKSDTLFEVGNGSSGAGSNAFEVYSDGHAEVQVAGTTDNSVINRQILNEVITNINEKLEGKANTYILDANYTKEDIKDLIRNNKITLFDSNDNDISQEFLDGYWDTAPFDNARFNSNVEKLSYGGGFVFVLKPVSGYGLNPEDTNVEKFIWSDVSSIFEIGDTILIVQTDVPDRWCAGVSPYGGFYALESRKIDLSASAISFDNSNTELPNNVQGAIVSLYEETFGKIHTYNGEFSGLGVNYPQDIGFSTLDEVRNIDTIIWNNPTTKSYAGVGVDLHSGMYVFKKQCDTLSTNHITFTCNLVGFYNPHDFDGNSNKLITLSLEFGSNTTSTSDFGKCILRPTQSLTQRDLPTKTSDLTNDSGFTTTTYIDNKVLDLTNGTTAFNLININAQPTEPQHATRKDYVDNIKSVEVLFDTPAGATEGTITAEQLSTLQNNKLNYINYDNQLYRLQDNEHDTGMLTYTYSGHSNDIVSKTISITISTLAWTLSTVSITSAITDAITSALEEDY